MILFKKARYFSPTVVRSVKSAPEEVQSEIHAGILARVIRRRESHLETLYSFILYSLYP